MTPPALRRVFSARHAGRWAIVLKTPHRLDLHLTAREIGAARMVPFLRRHIRSAHAMIASPLVELSIALVGDEEMSHLHQRFLDKSGPTDVLSFVLAQDGDDRPTSGEVVVCLPHARRRVARNRLSLRVEVLLYCLHGMLHLSGYDDRSPREYEIMHRTEDDILSRLGLPAAFALGSRVSP